MSKAGGKIKPRDDDPNAPINEMIAPSFGSIIAKMTTNETKANFTIQFQKAKFTLTHML